MDLAPLQRRAELILGAAVVVGVDDLQERHLAEPLQVAAEELLLGGGGVEPSEVLRVEPADHVGRREDARGGPVAAVPLGRRQRGEQAAAGPRVVEAHGGELAAVHAQVVRRRGRRVRGDAQPGLAQLAEGPVQLVELGHRRGLQRLLRLVGQRRQPRHEAADRPGPPPLVGPGAHGQVDRQRRGAHEHRHGRAARAQHRRDDDDHRGPRQGGHQRREPSARRPGPGHAVRRVRHGSSRRDRRDYIPAGPRLVSPPASRPSAARR